MTWSPERRAILVGALLVGWSVASVRIGFTGFDQRHAILTLLAGWAVAAFGLLTWLHIPGSRLGPLVLLTSATWFIAGVRWVDVPGVEPLAIALAGTYRGVAVHAVLTFPTGRTRGRSQVATIAAAYAASLVPQPLGAVLVAGFLVVGLTLDVRDSGSDPSGRRRRPAWIVGTALAFALLASHVLPAILPSQWRFDARIIDQLAIIAVATGLSYPLLRAASRREMVTDLVVELDPARGGLTTELARAIGDPTLDVGYWLPEQGRYGDPNGRVIDPSAAASDDRGRTFIDRDGTPVAVLIHDPTLTTDPAIRAAIARAAALSTANMRLRTEARAQAANVQASRRRILDAVDEERRALDLRLRTDVEPRLVALERDIATALDDADDPDPDLAGALAQLGQTRRDLTSVTNDLHPRILDELGLHGALDALIARSPVAAELTWTGTEPTDPSVRTALYFACSEALTNVAKHAQATSVRVEVRCDVGRVTLEVQDDGRGGADPANGTGLQGLRDRVATLGGDLTIRTSAAGGTHLIGSLPTRSRT